MYIYDVKWEVQTAGPSPFDNKRTELFLFGCKKAMNGNPCKGCFNKELWDSSIASFFYPPDKVAEKLIEKCPNKYITIGGGEPTDQIEELFELVKILKENGFHIIVYTWKSIEQYAYDILLLDKNYVHNFNGLFNNVDIIIDGEFKIRQKLYQEDKKDGFLSSIGSGNQIIWDCHKGIGYQMKDLNLIKLDENNQLIYDLKNEKARRFSICF